MQGNLFATGIQETQVQTMDVGAVIGVSSLNANHCSGYLHDSSLITV